jgi:hypothetical protein
VKAVVWHGVGDIRIDDVAEPKSLTFAGLVGQRLRSRPWPSNAVLKIFMIRTWKTYFQRLDNVRAALSEKAARAESDQK